MPVHERHRTKIDIQPTEPIIIPEDSTYIEAITLDKVPKAAQPSSKPIGVEIQIGFPPTAAVTTSSVITETTTYTQVTTETFQDEEDIPKIVEGDSVHTTIVRVDKEDESKPVELLVQMPDQCPQDVTEIVKETRTITTEEICALPMDEVEGPQAVHTETIEIVPDVQQEVTLPTKEAYKIEVTTEKERRPSAQKIEVEVHKTTMKQKPTEIIAVVKEVSGTEMDVSEMKDVPRPQDEQIEEVRKTIEKPKDEEIVPVEEVPEEGKPVKEEKTELSIPVTEDIQEAVETVISKTIIEKKPVDVKPKEDLSKEETTEVLLDIADQLSKDEKVEIEIPVVEEKEEVMETVVTETKVDQREKHIEELTMNIMGEALKEVQFSIPVKPVEEKSREELPEVTKMEQVTETVREEFTFEVPETEEVEKVETTLEVQEVPQNEIKIDFKMEQTEQEVPVIKEISEVESVIETSKEVITLPESEQEIPQELTIQVDEKPHEEVSFSFAIGDTETTTVESTTTSEITEETESQFTFETTDVEETRQQEVTFEEMPLETTELVIEDSSISGAPVSMDTTESEMSFTFQEQPSESVEFSLEMQPEKEITEQEITTFTEGASSGTVETFELPVSQETYTDEMTLTIEGQPKEETEFTIQLQEVEVPQQMEETIPEQTTDVKILEQEVPEVEGKYEESMTLQIEQQPSEEFEMTLEVTGPEKQTTVVKETTSTEIIGNVGEAFTFKIPESEESTLQISTVETEERPQEEIEMTFQLTDQQVPEVTEVTAMESTSESQTQEVTFAISEIEESDKSEITLEVEDKPKEEVKLTLRMPSKDDENVARIVITKEEKTEAESVKEATTTQEIFNVEIPDGDTPPEFTWGLTSLKVMDGEEAKFRCELRGIPTPHVDWFHNDKPIYETQDFHLTYDTETGACTLLIVEVFPQDAGEYRCEAVNPYGKTMTIGFLEVECKHLCE